VLTLLLAAAAAGLPVLNEVCYDPAGADAGGEYVEFHHGGPAGRSPESVAFTDADALDLLGTVGVLRVFSMNHRDLRAAVAAVRRYRDISDRAITLPASRKIADERIRELESLLARFEEQTGGTY